MWDRLTQLVWLWYAGALLFIGGILLHNIVSFLNESEEELFLTLAVVVAPAAMGAGALVIWLVSLHNWAEHRHQGSGGLGRGGMPR